MDNSAILEIIRQEKCNTCYYFLSVFPIHFTCVNGQGIYKCGRCNKHKLSPSGASKVTAVWSRQLLFEKVAQHFVFPCSYMQCKEKLPWIKVEGHEKYCRYKIFNCPICAEKIKPYEIDEHFRGRHEGLIYESGSTLKKNSGDAGLLMMKVEGHCFFVYILENKIAVIATDRNKYSHFNTEVNFHAGDDILVNFNNLPIIDFDERVHCFDCIEKSCNLAHHPFSLKYGNPGAIEFMSTLGNEMFETFFEDMGILRYRITLTADETVDEIAEEEDGEQPEEEEEETVDVNAHVVAITRKMLMCPYCMAYLVTPIYMCSTGHTVCKICKLKLDKCPTCQSSLCETRNYPLEELASTIEVPCQYENRGCAFLAISSRMYLHETVCSFRDLSK